MGHYPRRSFHPAKHAFKFSDVKPGAILAEVGVIDPIAIRVERVALDKANQVYEAFGTNIKNGHRSSLTFWVLAIQGNYPMPNIEVRNG